MLIFQAICSILIVYQIILIIVGFSSIIDLKRNELSHVLQGTDIYSTIKSVMDKIRTCIFRIVVYSFIIIVLKYLSLS